ncbi:SIR2 family NAD-dependent protein deacylase [Eudoraea chungangensis]|uniref:SIR2 family NAD-dependent protein deacylase n=1 Tax=Eudoraea chungangensis TaxID=1481905 RepID=UPI0023EAADA5|nr:NAD-dependent deacylase [Eudoraea chungangensis]
MNNIVVLSGAGMSADSGIHTFRDADGLWEGHDVMSVASPQGFRKNPELVLDFYNLRRRQLKEVVPNAGHLAIAELEKCFLVNIITQNVDDLHERAGSTNVLHLHGELLKVRSMANPNISLQWKEDLILGQTAEDGCQLRPDIVWFGEEVPLLPKAAELTSKADILIMIGTSLQVYPAASLIHYAPVNSPKFFVDPRPSVEEDFCPNLKIIRKTSAEGVPILVKDLMHKLR